MDVAVCNKIGGHADVINDLLEKQQIYTMWTARNFSHSFADKSLLVSLPISKANILKASTPWLVKL